MTAPINPDRPNLSMLEEIDQRSRDIFRAIVESYLETGDPLGSRTLSQHLSRISVNLSPATIRNVMSDLEMMGLIFSPHTSAGRMPTNTGLRFFVDSFLEFGNLSEQDRKEILLKFSIASKGQTLDNVLTEASQVLSGLSQSAGLVITAKNDMRLKHIEFIRIEQMKALVVIVGENGSVENRIIELPPGTTASHLSEATNFLNARLTGRNISEAKDELRLLSEALRGQLDVLAGKMVQQGIAVWAGVTETDPGHLILSGHGNLIGNLGATEDLESISQLFDEIEAKEGILDLLQLAEEGDGVRIFIGSENKLFSHSGSSVVVAPYRDGKQRVVGALGIIGPTRLNYSRVVPMVDYTAKVVSRFLR
jgi:heat-inducible transcriptional repressor